MNQGLAMLVSMSVKAETNPSEASSQYLGLLVLKFRLRNLIKRFVSRIDK
jgi:hypothetical protein